MSEVVAAELPVEVPFDDVVENAGGSVDAEGTPDDVK
jgi:hypothetical protein